MKPTGTNATKTMTTAATTAVTADSPGRRMRHDIHARPANDEPFQAGSVRRAGSPVTFATYDKLVKRVEELERLVSDGWIVSERNGA